MKMKNSKRSNLQLVIVSFAALFLGCQNKATNTDNSLPQIDRSGLVSQAIQAICSENSIWHVDLASDSLPVKAEEIGAIRKNLPVRWANELSGRIDFPEGSLVQNKCVLGKCKPYQEAGELDYLTIRSSIPVAINENKEELDVFRYLGKMNDSGKFSLDDFQIEKTNPEVFRFT
jgi:hypothetical protein